MGPCIPWFALVLALGQASGATRPVAPDVSATMGRGGNGSALTELPIRKLHVPADKLGSFLPQGAVVHTMTPAEFEKLLANYRAGQTGRTATSESLRSRQPVSARLEARFDAASRRLIGRATWSLPAARGTSDGLGSGAAGGSGDDLIELAPWNLTARSVAGPEGDLVAGLGPEGGLLVRGIQRRATDIRVDWELPGQPVGDGVRFEAQVPNCAMSVLTLSAAPGWSPRVTGGVALPNPEARTTEIHFGGATGFSLEMSKGGSAAATRGLLTWQADHTYRFDESGAQLVSLIQFESPLEPVAAVSLILDEQFQPRELRESTPARWRRAAAEAGRARWTAEFRRPPLGSFQIRMQGTLPVTEGVHWHPPAIQVENAIARGETMTFAVAPSMRVEALTPGNYQQTYAGLSDDKDYRLVFSSPGGVALASAAPLLSAADVPDLAAFCQRLVNEDDREGVGGWVLSRMDEPAWRLAEDAADGANLAAADRNTLVSAVNGLLARPDFYNEKAWSKIARRPATRRLLGQGVAKLTPSELLRLNRLLLEDAFAPTIARRGPAEDAPGITVASARPEVEVTQSVLFDLRRDQWALIGQLDWQPVQGEVVQPSVWIPPGWVVARVVGEPEDRLLRFNLEAVEDAEGEAASVGGKAGARPDEDRGSYLSLQLARSLQPGERFRATIFAEPVRALPFAEPARSLPLADSAPIELELPEIRPAEFPVSGTGTYTLYLDPVLAYAKGGLPPRRAGGLEIRGLTKPPESSQYSFAFASPIKDAVIGLLPERPRYGVDLSHRITWDGGAWRTRLHFDVGVEQGQLRTIRIVATRPLPEELEWKIDGPGNSVLGFAPIAPAESADPGPDNAAEPNGAASEGQRHHYRLELAVGIDKRARLQAEWSSPDPEAVVPLLDTPEADRTQAVVEVASQTGRAVAIEAEGLLEADPAQRASGTEQGLIWTTAYARLPRDAALALTVPATSGNRAAIGSNQALVVCRSIQTEEGFVHRIGARLDCRAERPLVVAVPRDARLWRVTLDGKQALARQRGSVVEVADRLAEGPHYLELVYASAAPGGAWVEGARFEPPLPDWEVTRAIWDIERDDGATLIPAAGSGLTALAEFERAEPGSSRAEAQPTSEEAKNALDALDAAAARMEPRARDDLARPWLSLEEALPRGWSLVIDADAARVLQASSGEGEQVGQSPSTSRPAELRRGLAALDLVPRIFGKTIILSTRLLSDPSARGDGVSDGSLAKIAASAQDQGTDASGFFLTPAVLSARLTDPEAPGWSRSRDFLPTARRRWTFVLDSPGRASARSLWIIPDGWVTRAGRVATIVALGLLFSLSRVLGWGPSAWRRVVVGGLVLAACASLVGGLVEGLLSPAAWASTALGAGLLAWHWRRARGHVLDTTLLAPTGLLLLVPVIGCGRCAAADSIPVDDPYRVLVPYDPLDPARDLEQVVLPEALLRQLERGPATDGTPTLVIKADYEGIVEKDEQARWRGRLELFGDPREKYPRAVSLAFGSARVESVAVDGSPVDFLPPGLDARLDFALPNPGVSHVEVEFVTPLLGVLPLRELDFQVPAAAGMNLRLLVGARGVTLSEESQPVGLRLESEEGRVVLAGRFGPVSRIRPRWREGMVEIKGPERLDIVSAHLLNVTPATRDLFSVIRLEPVAGAVGEISFQLGPDLVIRRVEAPGLTDWRVEEPARPVEASPTAKEASAEEKRDRALVLTFEAPKSSMFDVRIQAMARVVNPRVVDLPRLVPRGATTERGTIGVRLPPGWSDAEQRFRNAEPESVDNFVEAWKQLGQVPPDGIAFAKRFQQRPLELTLVPRTPRPDWSARQAIVVRPNPHSRSADVEATIEVTATRGVGGLNALRVALPPGLVVRQATGERLYQWYREGEELCLLPTREIGPGWSARIVGRWNATRGGKVVSVSRSGGADAVVPDGSPLPVAASGVAPVAPPTGGASAGSTTPVTFQLVGPEWLGASQSETRWTIELPGQFAAEVDGQRSTSVTRSTGDRIEIESAAGSHSCRLVLRPVEIKVAARSVLMITVKEDGVVYDGRLDVDFGPASPQRLEFRAARGLGNLTWRAADYSAARLEAKGSESAWRLDPVRPLTGSTRVGWQAQASRQSDQRIVVPGMDLVSHPVGERLVLLYNLSESQLEPVDLEHLTAIELPAGFSSWPAGVAIPASNARLAAFRAEKPDWRLELVPRRRRSRDPAVIGFHQVDVLVAGDRSVTGASRWEILDQESGTATIEIPSDYRLLKLEVGGVAVRYPEQSQGRLTFPLFRRGEWQDIVLYWGADSDRVTDRLEFPRLTAARRAPSLVCVRRAAGLAATLLPEDLAGGAMSAGRGEWLHGRLDRNVELLAETLSQWELHPGPIVEERIIQLLARGRELETQLRECLLSQAPETLAGEPAAAPATEGSQRTMSDDGVAELLAKAERLATRRRELIARFHAEVLEKRGAARAAASADFDRSLAWAGSEATDYFRSEAPLSGIALVSARAAGWTGSTGFLGVPPGRAIRFFTCLALLAVVTIPATWTWTRLYWPAALAFFGVGWLQFSGVPALGAMLLLASGAGAAWILGGWLKEIRVFNSVPESSTRTGTPPAARSGGASSIPGSSLVGGTAISAPEDGG